MASDNWPISAPSVTRDRLWLLGFWAGLLVVAVSGGLAILQPRTPMARIADNVHWSVAFLVGAFLVWRGASLAAEPQLRRRKRIFATGLSLFALGQILWDVQVWVDWNPFPAPSDALFLCLGPFLIAGFWSELRQDPREPTLPSLMDVAILGSASLFGTLAVYLAQTRTEDVLQLLVLAAHPAVLFGAAATVFEVILYRRPRLTWPVLGSLAMTLSLSLIWLVWNKMVLERALYDGLPFGLVVSVCVLVMGASLSAWEVQPSTSRRQHRWSLAAIRNLPTVAILVAGLSIAVSFSDAMSELVVHEIATGGAFVLAVLALVRQNLFVRELQMSEERYSLVERGSASGIWDWDMVNGVVYYSQRFLDLIDQDQESLGTDPRHLKNYVHPEDGEKIDGCIQEALAQRILLETEVRILDRSGRYRWFFLRGAAIHADDGTPLRMTGSITDIQPQRLAQDALRESELRYRRLFEASPLAVVLVEQTSSGRLEVRNANSAADRLFGSQRRAQEQRPLRDVLIRFGLEERIIAVLDTGVGYANPDVTLEDEDGVRSFEAVIFKADSRQAAVVLTDATDRKRAQLRAHEMNQELEMRVEQRTAELRASNAELESFAYAASHDLRTPLRGIDGFTKLLEEQITALDRPDLEALCRRTRAGVKRMGETIDSLLLLSRTSRSELRPELVSISDLATEILKHRDLEPPLVWHVDPDIEAVADPILMRSLLENLLSNAVKFSSRVAEPRVVVTRLGTGCFEVSDNGAGFDDAYAEKLFRPFHRLHRQDEFEGIGIGLATCARIVARHAGSIRAKGEVGKGASFKVMLPERNHAKRHDSLG